MTRRLLCAMTCSWLSVAAAAFGQQQDEPPRFEIRLVGPDDAQGLALRSAVVEDLQRTPRRHDLTALAGQTFEAGAKVDPILAFLALEFDPALTRATVEFARADDVVSPGWLIHAVLRAGATAGVAVDFVDWRSSWLGQLVWRSTRNVETRSADRALARGFPAVTLALPSGDESAIKLLAATVRRLDGLDNYPLFEDEFLVIGRRVLLRRDLYWIGLGVWVALYWRGRRHPGREFRWLLFAAWLVAPVYAVLLLMLPALVATWHPVARWPAAAALLPVAGFATSLGIAIAGPAALRASGIPALLVILTLAAFVWHHLVRPSRDAGKEDPVTDRA